MRIKLLDQEFLSAYSGRSYGVCHAIGQYPESSRFVEILLRGGFPRRGDTAERVGLPTGMWLDDLGGEKIT